MGTPKQLAAVSSNFACSRYGDRSVAAFPHLACSKTAVLRGPLDQTFPRKRVLTSIPDLLCNLFIYIDKWWDGWPPHSRYKRLFMRRKYFTAYQEGPEKALQKCGFLRTSADVQGSKIEGSETFFDEQMVKMIFTFALHQFILRAIGSHRERHCRPGAPTTIRRPPLRVSLIVAAMKGQPHTKM